jgi:hypothetical protein
LTKGASSPELYWEAIFERGIGLILLAFSEQPNSYKRAITIFFIQSFESIKYFLGANGEGTLTKGFLIAAVEASRKSVSIFIFLTPCLMPSCISETGTP